MLLLALILALSIGCAESVAGGREVISPEGSDLGRPFSPGIRSDNLVYVSGAIGIDPGAEGFSDITQQTRNTMENIGAVLKTAGLEFSDVVSANVYLSDARHYDGMNRAYREFFPEDPPARATVEAEVVIPKALLEVSVVALDSGVKRRPVVPEGWPKPAAPFSWGIQAGDTLFLAGLVGTDPRTGEIAPGGISGQAKQTFENIGELLSAAGMDYRDVVSARVYLSDARDFQAMNDVFRTVFTEQPPARATVRARLANPELRIEVQCLAVKSDSRKVVGKVRPGAPFSPAIMANKGLYLSGMVGRGPSGFAAGDAKAQTRQTLESLLSTLKAGGLGFDDVVEATVFLSDSRYYDQMNEAYREMIPDAPPARATVGTPLMSPEALVEIMMVARESK
jgi:2-iminobutanoate/2-iminopropanoate deaminase